MAPITECVLFGSAGVSPVVWRAFNGAQKYRRDAGATKPLRDSIVRPREIFHMSSRKGAATWS